MTQIKRSKGRPAGAASWVSGPDPVLHKLHYAWLRHRCQARYRGEAHSITLTEWYELWLPYHDQRGRSSDSLVITRVDPQSEWSISNIKMLTRRRQVQEEHARRRRDE